MCLRTARISTKVELLMSSVLLIYDKLDPVFAVAIIQCLSIDKVVYTSHILDVFSMLQEMLLAAVNVSSIFKFRRWAVDSRLTSGE